VSLNPSRTALAQDGAALESECSEPAGRAVYCCLSPPFLNPPSTPVRGEAGRQGGVVWRADPDDRPAAPSVWGEVAGSIVGQGDPSQLGSERELCPHTTGYSSKLSGYMANTTQITLQQRHFHV
jgi:hypothetical protein